MRISIDKVSASDDRVGAAWPSPTRSSLAGLHNMERKISIEILSLIPKSLLLPFQILSLEHPRSYLKILHFNFTLTHNHIIFYYLFS